MQSPTVLLPLWPRLPISVCLPAATGSFVDSLVAPLSVLNALVVAVGLEKQDEISQTYAQLERIWDEYNVYEKTEDESFHV